MADDSWINSGKAVHWNSHGAAGAGAGRQTVLPHEEGLDVVGKTNANQPKKLVEGAGDFTKKDGSASNGVPRTKANETHSAFAWEQRTASGAMTGKVYVVLVDDLEELDDGGTPVSSGSAATFKRTGTDGCETLVSMLASSATTPGIVSAP